MKTESTRETVAYYGHHKCASSWFRRIFEDVGRWCGMAFEGFDNPLQFNNDLPTHITKHKLDLISFTNADKQHVQSLGDHKAVHIIRDPRDVLVSAYFSHRYSHATDGWPELAPHRDRLESLNEEEGLMAEIEFSECYLRQMYEWDYQTPGIKEIKFEQLTINPYENCLEIFEHLGLLKDEDCKPLYRIRDFIKISNLSLKRRLNGNWPFPLSSDTIPSHQLVTLVHQQRYKKLSGGRKQGESNQNSHYRKGKAGDWVNHFTPQIQTIFNQHYPDILTRCGYNT